MSSTSSTHQFQIGKFGFRLDFRADMPPLLRCYWRVKPYSDELLPENEDGGQIAAYFFDDFTEAKNDQSALSMGGKQWRLSAEEVQAVWEWGNNICQPNPVFASPEMDPETREKALKSNYPPHWKGNGLKIVNLSFTTIVLSDAEITEILKMTPLGLYQGAKFSSDSLILNLEETRTMDPPDLNPLLKFFIERTIMSSSQIRGLDLLFIKRKTPKY